MDSQENWGTTVGGGETMVRQQFKDEVDINNIINRYQETGFLPGAMGDPIFADTTMISDLKTAIDTVNAAQEGLKQLPRAARELLQANPTEFATKLAQASTQDQLVELGVLEKADNNVARPDPSPAPVETPQPASEPT